MKDFLNLTQLIKVQIKQLLDVAMEMRRMIASKHKKGPQFSGRTLANLCEEQTLCNTAAALAYSYLGGSTTEMVGGEEFFEKGMLLDGFGVNTLLIQHDNYSLIEQLAAKCKCEVINGGSRYVNPLLTLSVLATINHSCDRLSNLNVLLVGNREQSIVSELSYVFSLFESNLFAYIPAGDTEFTQRSYVNAVGEINLAFQGMDAVIDLGLQKYTLLERYYGNKQGITSSLMGKARVDAPLLFTRTVVDEKQQLSEYPYNAVDRQYRDYLAVIMAVLYTFYRN